MVCILCLMHWVIYLKTHIGARNNVGNRTLRFYIKVHIKINLMDPIILLFCMILCKLQSPAPSWWKQEQSTKVSVLDMISKANFKVALASSVFMQMADAMEGGNPQWGSECLRMWAADEHHSSPDPRPNVRHHQVVHI